MLSARILRNLFPEELVTAASQASEGGFLSSYGDTKFLLIHMEDSTGELTSGLVTTELSKDSAVKPSFSVMGFHTVVGEAAIDSPSPTAVPPGISAADIRRSLATQSYFAMPLRKRKDDGAFSEKISIGRARNKDIVLRHRSISKFHAWFEADDANNFYLADAGSKNGTRINDELVEPRKRQPLADGDRILLGSVQSVLVPPNVLWDAIHGR